MFLDAFLADPDFQNKLRRLSLREQANLFRGYGYQASTTQQVMVEYLFDDLIDLMKKAGVNTTQKFEAFWIKTFGSVFRDNYYIKKRPQIRKKIYQALNLSERRAELKITSLESVFSVVRARFDKHPGGIRYWTRGLVRRFGVLKMPKAHAENWKHQIDALLDSLQPKLSTRGTSISQAGRREEFNALRALGWSISKIYIENRSLARAANLNGWYKSSGKSCARGITTSWRISTLKFMASKRNALSPLYKKLRKDGHTVSAIVLLKIMSGTLHKTYKLYSVELPQIKIIVDLLSISTWTDCESNFPSLAAYLRTRSSGMDAQQIIGDAPAPSLVD